MEGISGEISPIAAMWMRRKDRKGRIYYRKGRTATAKKQVYIERSILELGPRARYEVPYRKGKISYRLAKARKWSPPFDCAVRPLYFGGFKWRYSNFSWP